MKRLKAKLKRKVNIASTVYGKGLYGMSVSFEDARY